MVDYSQIDGYLKEHLEENLLELSALCAQPSVAAQNWGLEECAQLVREMLGKRGFDVEILPTGGAPVVFGQRKGKSDKTLLIYNHYDVQPPEPLDLWETPPFTPTLRHDKLYARGVSDDKGHITSRLYAIDALLHEFGELPVNIKWIIEGEEEISSVHLHDFVRNHQELLKADACLWEFGDVNNQDVPQEYLGLRGICYVELRVETANQDVHSGIGGSIFPNAAWRLVWALNSLKGPDERIRIPGFYDDVVPPSERDRAMLAALPDEGDELRNRYDIKNFLKGIQGGTELQIAKIFEPTCTICGLSSGYEGVGSKTVLPHHAMAKVDFRLVPNMRPERVFELLRKHLDAEGFSDVQTILIGGEAPGRTDPDDPFVQMVVKTAEPVYGVPMEVHPMTGGSGPNYVFLEYLKLPVVTAGLGYPGTLAHAPNENARIDLYLKHAMHVARIISEFGEK
jgi:acetylornithine deacetylase/succinyl-diaminopimelate desuccinylase-like protein